VSRRRRRRRRRTGGGLEVVVEVVVEDAMVETRGEGKKAREGSGWRKNF
jgi:hypothetical protein